MARQCSNCKNLDSDYEWDGEDEYEVPICILKSKDRNFIKNPCIDCDEQKPYASEKSRKRFGRWKDWFWDRSI